MDSQKVIVSPDTNNTGWIAATGNFDSGDGGKASVMLRLFVRGIAETVIMRC